MPIYAYKCQACGHAKDVLQKMSDPVLTVCPVCGKPEFQKQVTAAGFQLKGSGWYVTDFRGGNAADGKSATPAGGADGKSEAASESSAAASAPAAAPPPAAAPAKTSTVSATPSTTGNP